MRKKAILFLMILLLLFSLILMISFVNLHKGVSFVHIGMGARSENISLIFLSFIGIVWAMVELIQIKPPSFPQLSSQRS